MFLLKMCEFLHNNNEVVIELGSIYRFFSPPEDLCVSAVWCHKGKESLLKLCINFISTLVEWEHYLYFHPWYFAQSVTDSVEKQNFTGGWARSDNEVSSVL